MILELLVLLLVVALAVLVVEKGIAMEPTFRNVMRGIIAIGALVWLLKILGVFDGRFG